MEPQMLPTDIRETVTAALKEDVGSGDLTAALIQADCRGRARVICRELAVICGTAWFDEVYRQLDLAVQVDWLVRDGDQVIADQPLCTVEGPARALLTGERTALNFLQTLSGTATAAKRFADTVAGTGTQVLDTRKTIPGLRRAQKYAIRCGGGKNHRIGLYDAILIKENHIMASGSIEGAVRRARELAPEVLVEVEVENLEELRSALACNPDVIMLDNFDLAAVREAVAAARGLVKLEVSGNITLERIKAIAATGVDYVSVGSLTKDVKAIDLSMRFDIL